MGTQAVRVAGFLVEQSRNKLEIVVDTGSDITLISEEAWKNLEPKCKMHTGQKIKIVQVTGKAQIQGFANIPIFFETEEGPVRIDVEAYIVKGMHTPFILGNDFTEQYNFSIMRTDGTAIVLGNSGRLIKAMGINTPYKTSTDGTTFTVSCSTELKNQTMPKHHKEIKEIINQPRYATIKTDVVLPPETFKKVSLDVPFPEDSDIALIEGVIYCLGPSKEAFGTNNTIVSKKLTGIIIANFSQEPIQLKQGQELSKVHDPKF